MGTVPCERSADRVRLSEAFDAYNEGGLNGNVKLIPFPRIRSFASVEVFTRQSLDLLCCHCTSTHQIMRIPLLPLVILCRIGICLAQLDQTPADGITPALDESLLDEQSSQLEPDELQDGMYTSASLLISVCAALYEAEGILHDLAPSPYAHLESKLGTITTPSNRGWSESLGWGHDGPLSTAFRLFPRLVNTLLSPLSLLSGIPGGGYITSTPRDERKSRKVKISKARRGKVETFWNLVNEAEKAGCEEVHLFKARVLMVSPHTLRTWILTVVPAKGDKTRSESCLCVVRGE